MEGLAQFPSAAEHSRPDTPAPPVVQNQEVRREPGRSAGIQGWRGVGWFACGVAGSVAIGWFIFLSRGEAGSKAEWFFGAVVFCVVMVAMWQALTIQRQSNRNAAEAAERLRSEVAAAEARSARDLALIQAQHRAEVEAREKLHRAEVQAQRELARIERIHVMNQLQKQAMIEVSRTVNAYTQMLAALWNDGAIALRIEDRDERERAMNPIIERIGQVVNEFSVELGNAHLLIEDDRLHRALDRVNEAALMAIRVAEEVHAGIVEGLAPDPNPIPAAQRLMYARAAEARHLAWELLRAGLESGRATTELG